MENSKLLSIIIPSYNMEDYLPRNLKNLIEAKDIDKIEIIIINDGSTDSTLNIAKSFQEKAPQSIVVIDKKNGHYGSCLNAAIKIAKGKYFRILDADDWFETDCLNQFTEKLCNTDSDLVVTLRVEQTMGKDGKLKAKYLPIKNVEYGKVYDASTFSIKDHSENVEFNMHSMTYKTNVIRDSRLVLPEGICYTDMLYCLIPLRHIKTLTIFDIYLYNYFVGREGNSTNNTAIKKNLSHICTVVDCMIKYLDKQTISDVSHIVQSNQLRYLEEALNIFILSVGLHRGINKKQYAMIRPIVAYCKKHNIEHRAWKKYYNRYWYQKNTCLSLNFCLNLYRLTHPLK